ncbi:hypothetical protein [Paracoccus sp. SM22M-07]|uniref:hypothetical protein n=1 Tax=Paracoccus sp. SM22M-07 TaxID=1520813 RepID=UPI00352A808C
MTSCRDAGPTRPVDGVHHPDQTHDAFSTPPFAPPFLSSPQPGSLGCTVFSFIGLAGLFLGGEALVHGSVGVARRLARLPLLIRLTVVGFGTSTSELFVSVVAALRGSPDNGIGNIVGSNIGNILLIVGMAALVWPIQIMGGTLCRDTAVTIPAALALVPILWMGVMVLGHHLPADAAWVALPWGQFGPVHAQGAGLAHLEHAGSRVLQAALNQAIHTFAPPEILNTDQDSQSTSSDWTDRLKRAKTKVSMNGKARYLDKIFIERLWRSPTWECVSLHAWETRSQARAGVGRWFTLCNHLRQHTANGGRAPAMVHVSSNATGQQPQAVA